MKHMIVAIGLLVFTTPALAQGPKEQEGAMMGGVIGSLFSMVPGGSSVGGQIAKSMAPTIGTFVGGAIGAQLDEQDRKALAAATSRAFSSGKIQSFKGKSGRGTVSVVDSRKNDAGQPCRTVKQNVVLANGQAVSDTVSACKGPKGWQI